MSKKKPADLTKTFNKNVAKILSGLSDLRKESGYQITFELSARKDGVSKPSEPSNESRIYVQTNIPFETPDSKWAQGTLGLLIGEDLGIRPYKHQGPAIMAEDFCRERAHDEADITKPKDILQNIRERAKANGLIPKQ